MQRLEPRLRAARPAQRFAVDRHARTARSLVQRLCPLKQPGGELFPLQQTEDSTERVLGGNAAGSGQKFGEKVVPAKAKFFNVRPVVGTAQHRQE